MAFTIKVRGAPTTLVAAEYICPAHGRVGLDVERDPSTGDAPGHAACPACGELAEWAISAPLGKVKPWEVVRGGWQKPERETWLDTRNLGEGQDLDDFREDRKRVRERQRQREVMELLKS